MQLQLHYTNYITPQLQLHYTTTTTTAALHHTASSSCGWGDRPGDHCNHCNHSKKHTSNHFSVHQWIRAAIRDSQQPACLPYRFHIFETSGAALCGTSGTWKCRRSTLITPRFTLCTLQVALCPLHSTLYILLFTLHTLDSSLHTLRSALYTLHWAPHTPHPTL